jgi:XTP/dITP diphosphohydrolase
VTTAGAPRQAAAVSGEVAVSAEPAPRLPLVLGTRSRGKLRELGPLVEAAGFGWCTLEAIGLLEEAAVEDGLETGDTFATNALAKARHFHARSGGRPVLAEDSGLCVEALGGAPGVYSKRWGAGPGLTGAALDAANTARLLEVMRGRAERTAAYECAAAIVWSGGVVTASGRTAGRLLEAPLGSEGFGYDPLFWSDDLQAGFATVSAVAKAAVSHRGRAVRAVLAAFRDEFFRTR